MTDESTVLNNLRTAHYGDWGLDLSSQEVHELWAEIETRDKRVAELEAERLELRKILGWAYDLDEYKDNPEVQKCTTNSIKLNRSNEMETKNRNQISEIRSGSTAPMGATEVGEVTTAMSGLVSVVSKLQDSIAKLEVILQPVLPQDYFEYDVPGEVGGSSDYSCPLAFSIENEIRRLSYLESRLYILLINIKL